MKKLLVERDAEIKKFFFFLVGIYLKEKNYLNSENKKKRK